MPKRPAHSAPLSLAAYVTWLAVATEPVMVLWREGWPPAAMVMAGLAGLVAVLLLLLVITMLINVDR